MAGKRTQSLQASRIALERACQMDPKDESKIIDLVAVLQRLDDYESLLELLESSIRRMPDSLNLRMSHAGVLASLGDFEAARESYRDVLERASGHVDAACALVHAGHGEDAGGKRGIDRLLAGAAPGSEDAFKLEYARARLSEEDGQFDEAFERYRNANRIQAALGGMDVEAKQRAAVTVMQDLNPEIIGKLTGKGDPSNRPVFIVGMPRSGTSLTEQILSRHPRVHALGEQTFLGEALRNLIMKAPRDSISLPESINRLGPEIWRQAGGDYVSRLDEIDPHSPRLTDKLPANFALLPWIRLLLPGARVIHVCRDPLATLASCIQTPFGDKLLAFTVEDWARFYGIYQALMQRWRPMMGAAMLEVKYEDLVSDVEGQTRRMVEFLGLDWSEACLHPEDARRAVRTASVRQVRRGVHMDSIDRWLVFEQPLRKLIPLIRESREWINAQTAA